MYRCSYRRPLVPEKLQHDQHLHAAALWAGAAVEIVLAALLVTTLMRVPNPAFTGWVAGVLAILGVSLVVGWRRERRRRERP